jgi:autotransporter-associated beta strand protein
MPLSASITGSEDITKIDFGSFSQSINSFVYISEFPKLVELTLRNTNLITFIDGFAGQRLNLSNKTSQPILLIAGNASDCSITQPVVGLGGIKKLGTGKLSLKGVNLYSGATEITEGVFEIETGVLGNGNYAGNVINNSQFSIISPTAQTISGIISGTGPVNIAGLVTFSNDNTYSGATSIIAGGILSISRQTSGSLSTASISNAGILDFAGTATITVPINISGSGEITKNGTSLVIFSGTNSYTGKTTLSAGIALFSKLVALYSGVPANWTKDKIIVNSGGTFAINVGGTGQFATSDIAPILLLMSSITNNGFKAGSAIAFDTTNAAGSTFTISDVIPDSTGTGSGTIGVAKIGTNKLVLSGTNTFTGQLRVASGIISVGNFNDEGVAGPLGAGISPISVGTTSESTLIYTGAATTSSKKILLGVAGGIIEITNAITLALSGIISGAGTIKKTGVGTLQLSAANTFSGNLTISAGVIQATNSSSLGIAPSQTIILVGAALEILNGITIANNIVADGSGIANAGVIRNISGINNIQGAIALGSSSRMTITAGTLNILGNVSNPASLFIRTEASGFTNFSGVISGTGTLTLVSGNLNLTNANTFSGQLTIQSGNCTISSIADLSVPSSVGASSLPLAFGNSDGSTATLIYIGEAANSNRTFQIGRNSAPPAATDTVGGTISASGSGKLTLNGTNFNSQTNATSGVGANRTLTLAGTGTGEIAGVIRDNLVTAPATGTATLSILKNETGTWTLSGANTFTGSTTISSGTLEIKSAAALGSVAVATTVASGSTLAISNNITLAAEPITISGDGYLASGAINNLSGNNTLSGAITLAANSKISTSSGTLTITGAIGGATRTLTLSTPGTITISGIITLTTGSFVKLGTGTAVLSAANSLTGSVSVQSGALQVSNAGALGTAAISVLSNAQLELAGAITFARPISIAGTGTLTEGALVNRSGNNTMSGAITLTADAEIHPALGVLTITGAIGGATRSILFGGAGTTTLSTGAIITLTTGTLTKQDSGILNLGNLAHSYTGQTNIAGGTLTRVVTSGATTATGTFTSTTLVVAFTAIPAIGSTWRFFPGETANSYATVSLTGAAGRTGVYNSANSTLTIS